MFIPTAWPVLRSVLSVMLIAGAASAAMADLLYHAVQVSRYPDVWADVCDVNDQTQMAGELVWEQSPARWTPQGGWQTIANLPAPAPKGEAFGLNENGHVVGWSFSPIVPGNEAILWTPQSGTVSLGALKLQPWPSAGAYDINDMDQVVGVSNSSNSAQEAFLWDPSVSAMVGLGDLPGGNFSSTARGINNAGQVCGAGVSNNGSEAFLWEQGKGFTTLGKTPDGKYFMSFAYGINNKAQIFGVCKEYSCIWDPENGLHLLQHPPGVVLETWPLDINDQGVVVGSASYLPPYPFHYFRATLWDAQGNVWLIDEFLDASSMYLFPLSGAGAINNLGQIVVRPAYQPFSEDWYLLLPFEPGDMNCDGAVTLDDLPIFLDLLAKGGWKPTYSAKSRTMAQDLCGGWTGDINQDGVMDQNDLQPFLGLLLGK